MSEKSIVEAIGGVVDLVSKHIEHQEKCNKNFRDGLTALTETLEIVMNRLAKLEDRQYPKWVDRNEPIQ